MRSPVRNQASPGANTSRRILRSVAALSAYPAKSARASSRRISPSISPTSPGRASCARPFAPRTTSPDSTSNRARRKLKRDFR